MPILNKKYQRQMDSWLGERKGYTLLYQATRDGCNSQTFHQLCDNKGPTVTLCRNTAGFVFGGYTASNWTSNGTWTNDSQAFLFRLQNGSGFQPKQFKIKPGQNEIFGHTSYGPTFGGGHDLCVFTNQLNKTGDYFQGNNNPNPGNSYDMQGDNVNTFTGNNLQFTDIEVYQVTDRIMPNLNKQYQRQLDSWLRGRKSYTLLYQATTDGCNSQTFHQLCDNKGPTVTLCRNTAGFVFGGYTASSWTSNGTWTIDGQAFLFRLESGSRFHTKQYKIKPAQKAYYNHASYGPTFGTGHDLCVFTGQVNKTGNYFQGNNDPNPGNSYDMQGDDMNTFTGNNLQFTEIEVYQVTVYNGKGDTDDTPRDAWRKIPQVSEKVLIDSIERYKPPEGTGIKAINILLLGPVGAGKSSFYNTVNSVFQGEITTLARCGNADQSLTSTYRRYRIKSPITGEPLKIRFCDTMGLENDGGIDLVDILAIIDGHIPDRFQFNTTAPISPESTGYNSQPTMDDRIHCIAFVVDGTAVDVFSRKILKTFKSLQKRLNPRGIPQVLIVTKPDKACSEVHNDVSQLFQSLTIKDLVEKGGQLLGLPGSCVFPVKNYESEIAVDKQINMPVLLCLKQMLRYAEDYLQDALASD